MNRSEHLQIVELDPGDWKRWRGLRLEALREAPDAFSATLADWQGSGDTELRWRARLCDVAYNAVASLGGNDVGMVNGRVPDADGRVHVMSMWVAPQARGSGVATALIDGVAAWARARGARGLTLDVMADNARAIACYRRNGFVDDGLVPDADACAGERRMIRKMP